MEIVLVIIRVVVLLMFTLASTAAPQVTALCEAIKHEDIAQAKGVLARGIDPNLKSCDGCCTPLWLAADSGQVDAVDLLLQADADPNLTNRPAKSHDFRYVSDGATPLHAAARRGYDVLLERLLESGGRPDVRNDIGETPLFNAAVGAAKILLRHGADANARRTDGYTPLHEAAFSGNVAFAELLLSHGAHVDARARIFTKGEPIYPRSLEALNALVARGLDEENVKTDGFSPLHFAAYRITTTSPFSAFRKSKYEDLVDLLIGHGASDPLRTRLHQSAARGDVDSMRSAHAKELMRKDILGRQALHLAVCGDPASAAATEIVQAKAVDISETTVTGRTALHYAADCGNDQAVALLVSKGLDVNAAAADGTPLAVAISNNRPSTVALLIRLGARLDVDTAVEVWTRSTIAHTAAAIGSVEVLKLLAEAGVDIIGAKDSAEETPLQRAAYEGHLEAVRFLVERGASINETTPQGLSALAQAAIGGRKEVANYLIDKGADCRIRVFVLYPKINDTLLHLPEVTKSHELAERLIACGAQEDASNANRETPLFSVARYGKAEVAELLLRRGASSTVTNSDGKTPLDLARKHGNIGVVRVLADKTHKSK